MQPPPKVQRPRPPARLPAIRMKYLQGMVAVVPEVVTAPLHASLSYSSQGLSYSYTKHRRNCCPSSTIYSLVCGPESVWTKLWGLEPLRSFMGFNTDWGVVVGLKRVCPPLDRSSTALCCVSGPSGISFVR